MIENTHTPDASVSNIIKDDSPKTSEGETKALPEAEKVPSTTDSATTTEKPRPYTGKKRGRKPKSDKTSAAAKKAKAAELATETSTKPAVAKTAKRSRKPYDKSQPEHTDKEGPLYQFFLDAAKDIYWAENAQLAMLQNMADEATTDMLVEAIDDLYAMAQRQKKRMEKVFKRLGENATGKKCDAMAGLIKEAQNIIEETPDGSMTRDAAIIIAAQKAKHYEIASYGGLVALALTLGLEAAADLLETTLVEEEDADRHLTYIAERHINFDALEDDDDDDD